MTASPTSPHSCCTVPVAFFIFNRPDLTATTFQRIREARPRQLLVVADGPRDSRQGEGQLCAETRAKIVVDWDCELKTNFSDKNLGCGQRMASGISWVFEQVDRAILLEDDCLPDPSFFPYCSEMLDRHATNPAVMSVSGFCARPLPQLHESYFFSRMGSIWGWATWRRAWQLYDFSMSGWDAYLASGDWKYFGSFAPHILRGIAEGKSQAINTWDYQWHLTFYRHRGLSVIPKTNLIENVGFRQDATHTTGDSPWSKHAAVSLSFPLVHPPKIAAARSRDLKLIEVLWEIPRQSLLRRVLRAVKRAIFGARAKSASSPGH